jgi:NAD(P)H-flavin reductase
MTWTSPITSHRLLTTDMLELVLAKPAGFLFQAGQFVQFEIPDLASATPALRSYSIASAPAAEHLLLYIKIVPGGKASEYLRKMRVGESISFRGPEGRFVVVPEQAAVKTFVATGSGIAPVISILEDEAAKPYPSRMHLVFGVRHENDVFCKERLETLVSRCPSFSYALTLSQPSDDWTGARGRVTEHVANLPKEGNWYLCGSLPMVKEAPQDVAGFGGSLHRNCSSGGSRGG